MAPATRSPSDLAAENVPAFNYVTGMFETAQALAVAVIALVPGAAYTFAFERVAGSFGAGASDRLIRFLTASATFHAVFAGLTYYVYVHLFRSGDLSHGRVDWWVLELAAIGYVGVPTAIGSLVAHGKNRGWQWASALIGASPEPRAWDYLWSRKPAGFVRMRTKSGVYLGGVFGRRGDGVKSYAAGYPESGDIFLARGVEVDATTGEFLLDAGQLRLTDGGMLIRWDEIEYLELFEA
jgi:hypothetical protein